MSEPILKEKDGDVTTITLNRPEVGNRQTDATWAQLTEMLDIAAKESRLIVFKGAKVRHKVTPIGEGERRVVWSMTYCADPRNSAWQGVKRRIKDTAFFGLRALWT